MTQRFPLRALALATMLPAVLAACQKAGTAYEGPYAKEVNAAIPSIEKSVGLKFKTMPKVESRTKDEVRAFLEKKFDEDQPAPKPTLLKLPDVGLLRHMGAATVEGRIERGEKVIVNIKTFMDGHRPPDRVIPAML